jgi:hypothetical protein
MSAVLGETAVLPSWMNFAPAMLRAVLLVYLQVWKWMFAPSFFDVGTLIQFV